MAEGVQFSDGVVALRWLVPKDAPGAGHPTSVVFHDNGIDSVRAVHGHGGRTRVVWLGRRAVIMRRGFLSRIAESNRRKAERGRVVTSGIVIEQDAPPIVPASTAPTMIAMPPAATSGHCCFGGCVMVTCQCGGRYCVNVSVLHKCNPRHGFGNVW